MVISFEQTLNKAEQRYNSQKSSKNYFFKISLQNLYTIVEDLIKKYPDIDEDKLLQLLMNKVNSLTESAFSHAHILNTIAGLNAALYLKSHLDELKSIEKSINIDGFDISDIEYGKSFKQDCQSIVIEMLHSYNEAIEEYKTGLGDLFTMIQTSSKDDLKKLFANMSVTQKKAFVTAASHIKHGLVSYIDDYVKTLEADSKTLLIDAICSSLMHLDDFDVLKDYISRYNKQILEMLPSDNLTHPTISNDDSIIQAIKKAHSSEPKDFESLKALLKNISFYNLVFMNTFYINRLEKETADFVYSIFYAYKSGLFKEWIKGNPVFPTSEEAKYIMIGTSILTSPTNYFYISQVKKYASASSASKDKIKENIGHYIQEVSTEWAGEYEAFFQTHLPNSLCTSLESDMHLFMNLYNPIFMQYQYKDKNIISSLIALTSSKTQNWGLSPTKDCPYDPNNRTTVFSIDTDLNFPLRFHVSTKTLEDFFKNYKQTSNVPMYLGTEDFIMPNNRLAATHILLPLSPRQKTILKKLYKAKLSKQKRRKIDHMYYLCDKKRFPEHLQVLSISKTGKPKYIISRFFVDLVTGKMYQEKNGNLEEISTKKFYNLFNPEGFGVGGH